MKRLFCTDLQARALKNTFWQSGRGKDAGVLEKPLDDNFRGLKRRSALPGDGRAFTLAPLQHREVELEDVIQAITVDEKVVARRTQPRTTLVHLGIVAKAELDEAFADGAVPDELVARSVAETGAPLPGAEYAALVLFEHGGRRLTEKLPSGTVAFPVPRQYNSISSVRSSEFWRNLKFEIKHEVQSRFVRSTYEHGKHEYRRIERYSPQTNFIRDERPSITARSHESFPSDTPDTA